MRAPRSDSDGVGPETVAPADDESRAARAGPRPMRNTSTRERPSAAMLGAAGPSGCAIVVGADVVSDGGVSDAED